jgi:hypothetical protein
MTLIHADLDLDPRGIPYAVTYRYLIRKAPGFDSRHQNLQWGGGRHMKSTGQDKLLTAKKTLGVFKLRIHKDL